MRRRALLGLFAASALDSQAKAWARPGTALKGTAGRLKQAACRWPCRAIPLPDFCRAATGMGLAGSDLRGADEWERVRERGRVRSMSSRTALRDCTATGFNDRATPTMLF